MWNRLLSQPHVFSVGLTTLALLVAALTIPPASGWTDPADGVTRLTADVALALWFAAATLLLTGHRLLARTFWVYGCAAFLVHVATAFDRVHHWSHGAAFDHVEATGGFGPGIFVSYLFSLTWAADALWWWAGPASYDRRPAWLDHTVHGFMAFIVFNGTVIYETGFIRYAGIVAFATLGALAVRRTGRESGSRPGAS
jgi:hypothetical protein